MRCSEFDARMQELLDDRKIPDQDSQLLSHAENCPNCAARLETLTCLLDALDLYDPPELSAEFAQRVVDSVQQERVEQEASPRKLPGRALLVMTVAASLLLLAVPLTRQMIKPGEVAGHSASHPASAVDSTKPQPRTKGVAPTELSPERGEDWLVSGTLRELYSQATHARHREQINKIADDLRPITAPFNAALTALRRSLPVRSSETQGEPHAVRQCTEPPHVS